MSVHTSVFMKGEADHLTDQIVTQEFLNKSKAEK